MCSNGKNKLVDRDEDLQMEEIPEIEEDEEQEDDEVKQDGVSSGGGESGRRIPVVVKVGTDAEEAALKTAPE